MRRACLVGAIAASSLVIGVAASSAKSHKTSKPTTMKSTCHESLSVAVPAGQSGVLADSSSGTMFGTQTCSKAGAGVISFPFSVASSGDIVGKATAYFATGTVTGKVDLSETSSAPPTPYAFGNADLTGTYKVTKGTGADAGISGNGTFTCSTPDSIHYSCTLKLTLK